MRPQNKVKTAIRKGGPVATQKDPSTCKARPRCGHKTALVRKGGVEGGNRVKAAIGLGYSRKMLWLHSRVKAIA